MGLFSVPFITFAKLMFQAPEELFEDVKDRPYEVAKELTHWIKFANVNEVFLLYLLHQNHGQFIDMKRRNKSISLFFIDLRKLESSREKHYKKWKSLNNKVMAPKHKSKFERTIGSFIN